MKLVILFILSISTVAFAGPGYDCVDCNQAKGRAPAIIMEENFDSKDNNAMEMMELSHAIERKVSQQEGVGGIEEFLFLHPFTVIEQEDLVENDSK